MTAFRARVRQILGGTADVRPLIAAADAAGRATLRRGDRRPAVAALQAKLGLTPADGIFGPVTEAAVRRFQAEHIDRTESADGIVGPKTWAVLDAA